MTVLHRGQVERQDARFRIAGRDPGEGVGLVVDRDVRVDVVPHRVEDGHGVGLHDDGRGLGLLPLRVVGALVRTRRRQADVGTGHGKRAVIALEIVDQAGVFPCRGQVSVRERLRPLPGFRENGAVAVDPQFAVREVQRAGRLSDFLSPPLRRTRSRQTVRCRGRGRAATLNPSVLHPSPNPACGSLTVGATGRVRGENLTIRHPRQTTHVPRRTLIPDRAEPHPDCAPTWSHRYRPDLHQGDFILLLWADSDLAV